MKGIGLQHFDELNVANAPKKQTTSKVEMVVPKEMKQLLKAMKAQKGKKKNGR